MPTDVEPTVTRPMHARRSTSAASQKGLRTPERVFRAVLWCVAVIFAGFLIGLNSLVVRDLPTVGHRVDLSDFIEQPRAARLDESIRVAREQMREAVETRATLDLQAKSAQADYRNARLGLANWLATRQSTQRSDQDPEVIGRTRALDALGTASRQADAAVEQADAARLASSRALAGMERERAAIDEAARDTFATARRHEELRVFAIRLAITMPPIALAVWLFARKRRSSWWPFVWGFVLFAGYTFIVELVPYLPSFRGYVRYALGIVITVAVGRYAIVAMQRYLERQRIAEQQSEAVRRSALSYEHAIKNTHAGVCPGCERGFRVHEGQTNFCMHCGMKLFEQCPTCTHRKNAFFHYCPSCGTDKPASEPALPDTLTVAPVA